MKIGVHTVIWGRHDTVKIFASHINSLGIPVIAGVSNEKDKAMALSLGFSIYEHSNLPLSTKCQAGIKYVREAGWDAVLFLGSDDIIDKKALASIKKALKKNDMVAFGDIYLYDRINDVGKYWGGYGGKRQGEPAGAGRALTMKGLEKIGWQVWPEQCSKGIDGMFWKRCQANGLSIKMLSVKNDGLLLDIKDDGSLSQMRKFMHLQSIPDLGKVVEGKKKAVAGPIMIALYVAVWKRPEITLAHMRNVERIANYDPKRFSITPIYVVSEAWAVDMCRSFGFNCYWAENNPLGHKLNQGLSRFIDQDFDWFMQMGSDDFIEPCFLDEYELALQTEKFFGLNRLSIYDSQTGRQSHIITANVFGALRCIRWSIVKEAAMPNGIFRGLWSNDRNRALDGDSMTKVAAKVGVLPTVINISTRLWDLKSEVNINSFDSLGYSMIFTNGKKDILLSCKQVAMLPVINGLIDGQWRHKEQEVGEDEMPIEMIDFIHQNKLSHDFSQEQEHR